MSREKRYVLEVQIIGDHGTSSRLGSFDYFHGAAFAVPEYVAQALDSDLVSELDPIDVRISDYETDSTIERAIFKTTRVLLHHPLRLRFHSYVVEGRKSLALLNLSKLPLEESPSPVIPLVDTPDFTVAEHVMPYGPQPVQKQKYHRVDASVSVQMDINLPLLALEDLLHRIDQALDNKDESEFMRLTDLLQECKK